MYSFFFSTLSSFIFSFFFFNDTATTEIYTLSLHDALPISRWPHGCGGVLGPLRRPQNFLAESPGSSRQIRMPGGQPGDRKSTRLNSSHSQISYAVFCLKKKKKKKKRAYSRTEMEAMTQYID